MRLCFEQGRPQPIVPPPRGPAPWRAPAGLTMEGTRYGYLSRTTLQRWPPAPTLRRWPSWESVEVERPHGATRQQPGVRPQAEGAPDPARPVLRRTKSAPTLLLTTASEWHFAILDALLYESPLRAATLVGLLISRGTPAAALQHAARLRQTGERLPSPLFVALAERTVERAHAWAEAQRRGQR